MQAWRLRVAWIVLISALTPAILAYAAVLVRVRTLAVAAANESATPNPAKMPDALGPFDALATLDPTWTGIALIWSATGTCLVVAFAAAAAKCASQDAFGRTILTLRLAAFAAGLPLAWPWISVLLKR